jgi:hypothetical protein
VRQAAGKFAPGGDALGLHQALALADQLARHVIEAARQHANLVAPAFGNARLPVAAATSSAAAANCSMGRETRAAIHRLHAMARECRRCHAVGDGANVLLRLNHAAARDGHGEHREDVAASFLRGMAVAFTLSSRRPVR